MLSTPRRAAGSVSFLAKSAITLSDPAAALFASSGERNIAQYLAPVFATCFKTSFPTVPLAPVTKIISFSRSSAGVHRLILLLIPSSRKNAITVASAPEVRRDRVSCSPGVLAMHGAGDR